MSKLGLDKAIKRFERIRFELPKIVANDCVRFWLDGFQKEGFTNVQFEPWKPRKGKQTGRNSTRRILVDSGALRRSVSNSVKEATWQRISFKVELPYAVYHMTGTGKMPKRKFMGDSVTLRRQLTKKTRDVISKIWQG